MSLLPCRPKKSPRRKRWYFKVHNLPEAGETTLIDQLYYADKSENRSAKEINRQRNAIWKLIFEDFNKIVTGFGILGSTYPKLFEKWRYDDNPTTRQALFTELDRVYMQVLETRGGKAQDLIRGFQINGYAKALFANWTRDDMNRMLNENYSPTIGDCARFINLGCHKYIRTKEMALPDTEARKEIDFYFIDELNAAKSRSDQWNKAGNDKSILIVVPVDQPKEGLDDAIKEIKEISSKSGNLRIDVFCSYSQSYETHEYGQFTDRVVEIRGALKTQYHGPLAVTNLNSIKSVARFKDSISEFINRLAPDPNFKRFFEG